MLTSQMPEKVTLSLRMTLEEQQIITIAARREHRSVNSYVTRAALRAAQQEQEPRRGSREEIQALLKAAREAVRAANPQDRDLAAELLAERRAEAAND